MTIHTSFDNLEDIVVSTAEGVRPPERLTVSEAAEKYRYINNQGSYVGEWDNTVAPYLVEPMDELTNRLYNTVCFIGPAQCGKALALDTPIPTPHGWTTMGALNVGDEIFGADGKPCRVTAATGVMHGRPCYNVTFRNGERVVADAEHNWPVFKYQAGLRDWPAPKVMTTKEVLWSRHRYTVPTINGFELPEKALYIDPYLMGAWLGDGHAYGMRVYAGNEDVEEMRANLGVPTRAHQDSKGLWVIALTEERHNPGRAGGRSTVSEGFAYYQLGSGQAKRVPVDYLRASREQRMAVLQGLLDTDGHATTAGHVEFSTSYETMADTVRDLLTGLGYAPRERFRGRSWTFAFAPRANERLFRLERKQVRLDRKRRPVRQDRTLIERIERTDSVPVRCITVDSADHCYVFGRRGTVTHNTDMFLNYQAYTVICDPADLMLVQTKQGTARDFSITRVDRLHRHSEEVGKRLLHRQNADNTYDKQYQSGMVLRLSWPSVDELSGRPIPRLWLTDYDRMTQDVDGEGTPYMMAQARTTSFRSFGKVAVETSPGFMLMDPQWVRKTPHEAPPVEGGLAIYNMGDRRRYYWQCVECRNAFEPHYNLLAYPDTEDPVEAGEQCYLVCPHCGHWYYHDSRNGDPGKFEMNQLWDRGGHARWLKEGQVWMPDNRLVGTARRSDVASFWLFGVCAAFSNWKSLVTATLNAEKEYAETGAEETLKTVTNTKRGEVYTPKAQALARSPQTLKARARDLGIQAVPPGVRFLIATVDIQKNRFVVQVHGIGVDGDITIIDRYEIKYSRRKEPDKPDQLQYVNPGAHPEDWRLLVPEVMEKTYPLLTDPDRSMAIYYTFSDSGGREGVTKNAYEFYRWLRYGYDEQANEEIKELYPWKTGFDARFQLIKGEPRVTAPRVRLDYPDSQRKDRNAGARGEIPILFLNSNMLKDELDTRLERVTSGGRINFPDWLGDNFYKELTVETRGEDGKWENINNYRNESWDLLVYCLGGLLHVPVGFAHISWDDPPLWAAEWDRNDLVFSPKEDISPLEAEPEDEDAEWQNLGAELT